MCECYCVQNYENCENYDVICCFTKCLNFSFAPTTRQKYRLSNVVAGFAPSARRNSDSAHGHKNIFYCTYRCINPNVVLIKRAVEMDFVIPMFQGFQNRVERIFDECNVNTKGNVSRHIKRVLTYLSKKLFSLITTPIVFMLRYGSRLRRIYHSSIDSRRTFGAFLFVRLMDKGIIGDAFDNWMLLALNYQ